jgi:hypothetical protein
MKTALWSLLSLALFGIVPLSAQNPPEGRQRIISVASINEGGASIHGLSVGFFLRRAHLQVSIAAHLTNSGGIDGYAGGTAYLTRKIGPHSSSIDEVAKKEFELPAEYNGMFTLFEGLDLAPGEYWLVFDGSTKDEKVNYANWLVAMPMSVSANKGTRYLGSTAYGYPNRNSSYLPATFFGEPDRGYGYQFVVVGEPVPLLKDEDPGRATLR